MAYKNPEDQRACARRHYQANKEVYKARAREFDAKRKATLQAYILDYLEDNPCVDCGETDPIVLEFDHRPGVEKLFNIASIVRDKITMKKLVAEIEKCDVRCANCHRRVTYERKGFTHRTRNTK